MPTEKTIPQEDPKETASRLCATCGQPFEAIRSTKKYCSPKCRNNRPGKPCGKPIMVEKECECCGRPFVARKRSATKTRGGTARRCSMCHYRGLSADDLGRLLIKNMCKRIRQCRQCGGIFTKGIASKVFCSSDCSAEYFKAKKREECGWDTVRSCGWCGEEFDSGPTGGKRSNYCSPECKELADRRNVLNHRQSDAYKQHHRTYKAQRRARIRSLPHEPIDPFAVFARDGWTCQICGDKTPRKLRGTYDDKAPELDHIIPLAAGGPHTWDNVQCACRSCNGTKGDGSMNSQLRLELSA